MLTQAAIIRVIATIGLQAIALRAVASLSEHQSPRAACLPARASATAPGRRGRGGPLRKGPRRLRAREARGRGRLSLGPGDSPSPSPWHARAHTRAHKPGHRLPQSHPFPSIRRPRGRMAQEPSARRRPALSFTQSGGAGGRRRTEAIRRRRSSPCTTGSPRRPVCVFPAAISGRDEAGNAAPRAARLTTRGHVGPRAARAAGLLSPA